MNGDLAERTCCLPHCAHIAQRRNVYGPLAVALHSGEHRQRSLGQAAEALVDLLQTRHAKEELWSGHAERAHVQYSEVSFGAVPKPEALVAKGSGKVATMLTSYVDGIDNLVDRLHLSPVLERAGAKVNRPAKKKAGKALSPWQALGAPCRKVSEEPTVVKKALYAAGVATEEIAMVEGAPPFESSQSTGLMEADVGADVLTRAPP